MVVSHVGRSPLVGRESQRCQRARGSFWWVRRRYPRGPGGLLAGERGPLRLEALQPQALRPDTTFSYSLRMAAVPGGSAEGWALGPHAPLLLPGFWCLQGPGGSSASEQGFDPVSERAVGFPGPAHPRLRSRVPRLGLEASLRERRGRTHPGAAPSTEGEDKGPLASVRVCSPSPLRYRHEWWPLGPPACSLEFSPLLGPRGTSSLTHPEQELGTTTSREGDSGEAVPRPPMARAVGSPAAAACSLWTGLLAAQPQLFLPGRSPECGQETPLWASGALGSELSELADQGSTCLPRTLKPLGSRSTPHSPGLGQPRVPAVCRSGHLP